MTAKLDTVTPEHPRSLRSHVLTHPRSAADNALLLIVDDLRSGAYDIGSKLPSIKEIAADTGISHVNVRAALQRLQDHGVVEVQRGRGGGVTVLGLSAIPEVVSDLYAPVPEEEMIAFVEAWTVLEREILILTSRRANAADLVALRAKIERLHLDATENPVEFAERTVQFHVLASAVAENPFLGRQFSDVLNQTGVLFSTRRYYGQVTRARRELILDQYDRLMTAIEGRDEAGIIRIVHERHVLQLEMLLGVERAASVATRSEATKRAHE